MSEGAPRSSLEAMLDARSVAIVGASDRAGSFGRRVIDEMAKSPSDPAVHLVNPRYDAIDGRRCFKTLDEVPEPVDLVLMCVPDAALEAEMRRAAQRGDHSAVLFGSAFDPPDAPPIDGASSLRQRITSLATEAGMALCGGGCMGFVNVSSGLRAIGYVEPDPIPHGPLALVSCSGSAFSALLRTNRRFGWTLVVSSGQELVTPACAYVDYAVATPETKVVALLLEQMSDPVGLRAALGRAAERDVAVVALTVGGSVRGSAMVAAHSGALAGADGAWEALFDGYGVIRVSDLDEMTDTLELFSSSRRARQGGTGGLATVHDSGAERALVVDVADELSVPFGQISEETAKKLGEFLDPGLEPINPLDLWGTGADIAESFGGALGVLADDPEVDVVALCIDFVHEFDDDHSYEQALYEVFGATTKPVALLSNVHSAIDPAGASRLREAGIPVLEGTRTGLKAIRHLLELREFGDRPAVSEQVVDEDRKARWMAKLSTARSGLSGAESLRLLSEYGLPVARAVSAMDRATVLAAADEIGFPIVLKTDVTGIDHKSDVGGVIVGIRDSDELGRAYEEMSSRLGAEVLVAEQAPGGVELTLGIVRDPGLGPLVVVGAGGVLVEVLRDIAVALPPLDGTSARRLIDRLSVRKLLDGVRGEAASDIDALCAAIVAVSQIATELGDVLEALDVNPVRC